MRVWQPLPTLLLFVWLLSACAPSMQLEMGALPRMTDETTSQLTLDELQLELPRGWTVRDAQPASARIQTDGDATVAAELLRFDQHGETALAAIEEAARESSPAERRHWISTAGARQGELLIYEEAVVGFLQPPRSGSTLALRLEAVAQPEIIDGLRSIAATSRIENAAADVLIEFVEARQVEEGTWTFAVTLRHPDTGWDDYADGWQVATGDGSVLGTRILLHPHENEQPFTRSLTGVVIDPSIQEVQIVAHDLVSGYVPETVTVPLTQSTETEQYRVDRD